MAVRSARNLVLGSLCAITVVLGGGGVTAADGASTARGFDRPPTPRAGRAQTGRVVGAPVVTRPPGVPVFGRGSVVASAVSARDALPSGTTPVQASSGVVTTGIDASVTPLNGAITGKITSVTSGGAVNDASVFAMGVHGRIFGEGYSGDVGRGRYVVRGLAPGGVYRVCVYAGYAGGAGSATGYLSRCYTSAAWSSGGAPPADADPVSVSAGTTTGIDVALPSGAAIAGTVRNRAGKAVRRVGVLARNRSTGQRFFDATNRSGHYRLAALTPAAHGYAVCFAGADVRHAATGYLDECWKNHPWAGERIPTDTTPVPVHIGKTHTGVNPVLGAAGAIAGQLTDAHTGYPIFGEIDVFSSAGKVLARTGTNQTGHYLVKGLHAHRAYVCAGGEDYPPTMMHKNRCYKNVAWPGHGSGLPSSGLTGVRVRLGETHHHINFALPQKPQVKHPKTGTIAGIITSGVDGSTPLKHATVVVFQPGARYIFHNAETNASGAYKVRGLPPTRAGYIVCAIAYQVSSPTPPTGGWAPRCYKNADWDGGYKAPPAAIKLPLAAGQAKHGIDITLPVGATIAGQVTVSGTTDAARVIVYVFNTHTGQVVNGAPTRFNGSYKIRGLQPGSYTVCFDGQPYSDNPDWPYGFQSECYNDIRWTNPPSFGD